MSPVSAEPMGVQWIMMPEQEKNVAFKNGKALFPLQSRGLTSVFLELAQDAEMPYLVTTYIIKGKNRRPIQTPNEGETAQVGVMKTPDGSDRILLRTRSRGNAGLIDEAFVYYDPESDVSVWLYVSNQHGPVTETVSSNYSAPENQFIQRLLKDWRQRALAEKLPNRRS